MCHDSVMTTGALAMDIVAAGTRPALRVRVFEPGKSYGEKAIVIHRCKYWIALRETSDAPPSKDWSELKARLGW
jgi:hypothetical protein